MKALPLIGVCAVLVTACGGGGGGMPAPPPVTTVSGSDIPVSATQDPKAAYDFVASVAASSSDSSEPLVAGDATLATSETDEPQPL
jgi:hypothetical protein